MAKRSMIFLYFLLAANIIGSQTTREDFLADLEQLGHLIKNEHVSPYWIASPTEIEAAISSAKKTIIDKSDCDQSCYVELMQVIASLRDGHSTMSGTSRYEVFGYLPISIRWFDGELRIIRAAEKYTSSIGYRIDKVNGMPISEVMDRLKAVVPQANDSRFKKFVGSYLHLPGLLYGLGISSDPEKSVFSLSDDGVEIEMEFVNMSEEESDTTRFISFLDDLDRPALYQKNNDKYYWFEYDEEQEILYFQYNRVGNMDEESSSVFAGRLWASVDSLVVSKFVLDLRYNGGGNFAYSVPYIQGILDLLDLNRRGRLFVVTGYDTFSAAIRMLTELELRSEAILAGEYPCDRPASPGDAETYTLDQTGVRINLSSLFHPTVFPNDQRDAAHLDAEIITTWKDYKTGIDPVMEYIRSYREVLPETNPLTTAQAIQGSYAFSPTRNLRIGVSGGLAWIEISHALRSPLYHSADEGLFDTEIVGLQVEPIKGRVNLLFPDGSTHTYDKLEEDKPSPLELFYLGRTEDGKRAYRKVQGTHPGFIELKDHQMSFAAILAYFELKKYPHLDASKVAKAILNTGIEINPGEAPFCEFSLRFY